MNIRVTLILITLLTALIAGCGRTNNDYVADGGQGGGGGPAVPPPQAANIAYQALGNSPLNVTAAQGVTSNDPVVAPVAQFQNPSAQGGAVAVNADGSFAYTPPTGFAGADTFTYTSANAAGQSQATVTVTITNLAWYVNNAGANGDGSFATPFNNLTGAIAAAGVNDTIFVYRGDGTNTGLAGALALQNGQQLLGEGAGLNFNNGINPRTEDFLAQQIVNPGQFPVLTGPITLADGNTVSGVRLEGAVGDGIAGTGITGVTLSDNQIDTPTGAGVVLTNAMGSLTLTNNTVTSTGGIGFDFQLDSVNPVLTVQGNQFTNTGNQSLEIDLFNTANVVAALDGNTVTNSGPGGGGMQIIPNGTSVLDLTATGNTINGTQSVGFALFPSDSSQATARFLNNTITGAPGEGLSLVTIGGSGLAAEVQGNTLTGNGANFGFFANTQGTSSQCLAITGNTTDRFVFFQSGTIIRVEDFANLEANNNAGTVFEQFGNVTDVPGGTCGF